MVSRSAVTITAALHLVLGVSFFIKQKSDLCSKAPPLASWLFIIGFFDLLLDMELFPLRYRHLPFVCQIVTETIMSLLLTEFSALIVWCTIEMITCKLCKIGILMAGLSPEIYNTWEQYILGCVTTALSLTFLLCVGYATDHLYVVKRKSIRLYRNCMDTGKQMWEKILRLMRLKGANEDMAEMLAQSNNCCPPSTSQENEASNYEDLLQPEKYETIGRYRRRSRSRGRNRRF
ncbi:uncharacterized protein LOC133333879 [Musca vetustissima]|uniref:uncharacterized protein LOC133333879 n=1 Tax=Musca vetustissima TaxID=27455 RepID=UPI002AB7EB09|nr:uncharacterized protein LOC133333879 [Musca vetustissima]